MKNIFSKISMFAIVTNLFMSAFFSGAIAPELGLNPLVMTGGIFTLGMGLNFVSTSLSGLSFMAIQTEIWTDRIEKNLFNGQEFVNHSVNHDGFVNSLSVNVPQTGNAPTIVKNRSGAGTIGERTDTVKKYDLDNYTTDPIRVKNVDQLQTSYDKVDSVLTEYTMALGERIGDECLNSWAVDGVTAKVLRTTGTADALTLPTGTSAGTRNALVKNDIRRLAEAMDLEKGKGVFGKRYLMLPSAMYYQLFNDAELLSIDNLPTQSLPEGVITKLFDFNIMVRPSVNIYDNVNSLTAVGGAEAITDCYGALAWSEFAVAKAQGETNLWINEKVAEHYGDVMSAEVQFGASTLRTGNEGVFTLAQGYNA